jgi:general secretion pathway protein D
MILRTAVLVLVAGAVWAQQPIAGPQPAAAAPAQTQRTAPVPAKAEPVAPAPAKAQPAVPVPAQKEPAAPAAAKAEPVAPAPAKAQPAVPVPAQKEPAVPAPAKAEPVTPAPAQAEPMAPEPAQTQPVAPQPAAAKAKSGGYELNLRDAPLPTIIGILAQKLRINYIIDPSVKGGAVTVNTFGQIKEVDTRALLETILRINGAVMVQVGNMYRIIPAAAAGRLPISPQTETKNFPEDERMMLNLVFLKYATVAELSKLITPFQGEGATIVSYEPANLLLILDNSRNMKRTMELIAMFDSDTLASQRVRLFEVKYGRPSDLSKELKTVMNAVSLGGEKATAAINFLAIDRINTIVAIAPNPGVFTQVETWLKRLDIEPKITAGTVDNYVYRVKYGWAQSLSSVIMQLYMGYGGYGMGGYESMGGYGGMMGRMGGMYGGMGGGYGGGMYGGMGYGGGGYGGNMYGGGMGYGGGGYGGGMYGGAGYGGYGGGGYGGYGGGGYGGYGGGMYGGGVYQQAAPTVQSSTAAGSTTQSSTTTTDLTGGYLGSAGYGGAIPASKIPRVIPNPLDNTLLIQATPQDYQQVLKLVEQLDVPPRQVLVEAKIFEVNMQGDFSSGVQAFLQNKGAAAPTGFPASRQPAGSFSGSAPNLALTAGTLVSNSKQLLGILTANEQNKRAKLVSAPSVIATDSIPATVNVGDAVPSLTGQAVNGIQSAGSSLFTQAISTVQTGVTLNVMARVTPGGIVTMVINQQVSAPVAPDKNASIQTPSFQNRSMSTQVTVQDGDTVAIAGIILETDTLSSSGIPFLHRIPGIGAAFGGKSITKSRTELVVFFTPRVIYDTNQITDATEEIKSRFKKLRSLMQE